MRERGSNSGIDIARVFEPDSSYADGFGHGREIRIPEFCAEIEEPCGFLLEFDEAERAIVEYNDFHRKPVLSESEEVAHQHGKSTIAG